jgi:hypothetical protein
MFNKADERMLLKFWMIALQTIMLQLEQYDHEFYS